MWSTPRVTKSTRVILPALSVAVLVAACGSETAPAPSPSSAAPSASPVATSTPDAMTPLVGSVPFAPIPFAGSDGLTHLVYELSVVNFTGGPLTISDIEVLNADTGATVGELDSAALEQRVYPAGSREATNVLQAGQAAMIFIHLPLAEDAPDRLIHEAAVTAEAVPPQDRNLTETLAAVDVDRRTLPVVSAPLVGERYISADGCCDAARHTRAVLPVNGELFVAQRYAIDYEQADDQNRIFTGDPKNPES